MTFYVAVCVFAVYQAAGYGIKRRQGFHGSMPVGSALLGAWAAYLLVA